MDTRPTDTTAGYNQWIGRTALDANGEKIGTIKDVYYDDVTGRPEWVAVKTGMLGSQGLAPIAGARIVKHTDDDDVDLHLSYTKDMIKNAPDVDDAEGHLSPDDERDLYSHYGYNYADRTATGTYGKDYGKLRPDVDYKSARYDRQRSEWTAGEVVGTEDRGTVEAEATIRNQEAQIVEQPETVRLRKYTRTEMVPVTKEEIRVEKSTSGNVTETTRRSS